MFSDRLATILEQSDLSAADLDKMLDGRINLAEVMSPETDIASSTVSAIGKVLKVSHFLLTDPEIEVPLMELSIGYLSSASKTRILQFIYNFRRLFLDLDMDPIPCSRAIIEKESDIYSLVREIIQSKLSLREYLETRGIYVIELDRCKGFEGGIYSCGDVLFIILNKDHSDERKFHMLIELSANCILYFDKEMSDEKIDNMSGIFCEEILNYLPCEQTFSILAKLVSMAVLKGIIFSENKKAYLLVPSR